MITALGYVPLPQLQQNLYAYRRNSTSFRNVQTFLPQYTPSRPERRQTLKSTLQDVHLEQQNGFKI